MRRFKTAARELFLPSAKPLTSTGDKRPTGAPRDTGQARSSRPEARPRSSRDHPTATSSRYQSDDALDDMASADTLLEDMRYDIKGVMVPSSSSLDRFVPESSLREIVNDLAVKAFFEENSPIAVPEAELTSYVCNEACKAFASLVYFCSNAKDLVALIEDFYSLPLNDEMLPIREVKGKFWPCATSPGSAAWKDRPLQFHSKSRRLVEHFCETWQWPFVPARFDKKTFEYEFPERTQLPFIECLERSAGGGFSMPLLECFVHKGYLPTDAVKYTLLPRRHRPGTNILSGMRHGLRREPSRRPQAAEADRQELPRLS